MHYLTRFLPVLLAAAILLVLPAALRADLVPIYPPPPTFENQQTMTLSLETDGAQLATSSIPVGSTLNVTYHIGYTGGFYFGSGTTSPEEKAGLFQQTLIDQKIYLELWRGEPFTPDASVAQTWELDATAEGNASMSFPGPGSYFLVAYMSGEVRDHAAYCIEYEIPEDVCEDPELNYFPVFPHEETQSYFQRPLDSETPWSDAYPNAFGGTRLTIAGGSDVSSVLFLPGIKGSRLYRPEAKLWEPFGNEDVRQLFLEENGKSVNADVYARAGDVLSEALSQKFYASFFEDLDALKASGTVGTGWTWESAAYDWRLSLSDLVTKGARYDDRIYYNETSDMPYIERLLRDLAATSPTGKVSIVAHSNGGLVAKALMTRLGDTATAALIDKVVLVGAPQSGAPRALGAALFGYGEALPFDECADRFIARAVCALIIDRETARMFAERSPMTYHLLPSEAYFQDTNASPPVARFNAVDRYQREILGYGNTIDTFDELSGFALAQDGGRTKPSPSDTAHANILSETLLGYARDIHATLDAWTPPAGVTVHEIAGWGDDTVSGIDFYEEPKYLDLFGDAVPRYRPTFFTEGDGVVPAASALLMDAGTNVNRYWADLKAAGRSHADMLEMPDMRTLIKNILTGSDDPLPANVYAAEPTTDPERRRYFFFLHSPLTLGITNSSGDYTGLNMDGTVSLGDPDITYGRFGDVQYLLVPVVGKNYTVLMHGLADGNFSLDMQEVGGNDVLRTTTLANVPVDTETVATLPVSAVGDYGKLVVDEDGNGVTDFLMTPRFGETVMYGPATYGEPPAAVEAPPASPATTTPPSSTPTSTTTPESAPAAQPQARANSHSGSSGGVGRTDGNGEEVVVADAGTQESLAAEAPPLADTSAIPVARTQTASAYDAFGSAVRTRAKQALLAALTLLLALALMSWKFLRK